MKIGVFAYNFEHKKTQEGLFNLFANGIDIECVLAADSVKLDFYQSKIRITPKDMQCIHPKKIAEKFGIPYHVVVHNSEECKKLILKYDLDLGIILGARILKEDIINSFRIGILNMHPGLLPQNRGLDNIKWAILKGFKQGVSGHLINKDVDSGELLLKKEINVYEDDTLLDILLRIQNLEQQMMVECIHLLKENKAKLKKVESETSFKAVPPEEEPKLMEVFEEYKKNYNNLQ